MCRDLPSKFRRVDLLEDDSAIEAVKQYKEKKVLIRDDHHAENVYLVGIIVPIENDNQCYNFFPIDSGEIIRLFYHDLEEMLVEF